MIKQALIEEIYKDAASVFCTDDPYTDYDDEYDWCRRAGALAVETRLNEIVQSRAGMDLAVQSYILIAKLAPIAHHYSSSTLPAFTIKEN